VQACLGKVSLDPESVAVAIGMLLDFSHAFDGEALSQIYLDVEVPVTELILQVPLQIVLIQSIRCNIAPVVGHCRRVVRLATPFKKAKVSRLQLNVGSVKWRWPRHKLLKKTHGRIQPLLQEFSKQSTC
jgi:hypothetical protein